MIFRLLISEFPNSSNGFDSLGEALYKNGEVGESLRSYKRSLQLDPGNANAEDWIFKIEYENSSRPKFDQVFSVDDYVNDMEDMANRIVERHPRPFEYISSSEFKKLVDTQKEKIQSGMVYGEFIWLLSPIIASIACEHTHLGVFNQEDEMLPIHSRFPLVAQLIDNQLIVTDAHESKEQVPIGSTIYSINGVPVQRIVADVFAHISSNGNSISLKRKVFSAYLTSYISYYFAFPDRFEVKFSRVDDAIQLRPLTAFQYQKINNEYSLEIDPNNELAKLKIPSFNYYRGENLQRFKSFLDGSFRQIAEKEIENLVIDIRGNGGGCSCSAIHLLKYIAPKPFTYFDSDSPLPGNLAEGGEQALIDNSFTGRKYILIDGFNTSTSGQFLSVVKANNMAVLVGEESGASFYANGGVRRHLGQRTGVIYNIATKTFFTTASSLPHNRGVLADYEVYASPSHIREKRDAQLEFVYKLLAK